MLCREGGPPTAPFLTHPLLCASPETILGAGRLAPGMTVTSGLRGTVSLTLGRSVTPRRRQWRGRPCFGEATCKGRTVLGPLSAPRCPRLLEEGRIPGTLANTALRTHKQAGTWRRSGISVPLNDKLEENGNLAAWVPPLWDRWRICHGWPWHRRDSNVP